VRERRARAADAASAPARAIAIAIAIAVALAVALGPADARADRPCSGLFLRADPGDALIEARTRNQLAGSRCTLDAVDSGPLDGSLRAQLERAGAVRADRLAVAWIDRAAGSPLVMVADVAAGRVFVREIEIDPASSAGAEAIAIVIAQALVALGEGAEIGIAMPIDEVAADREEAPAPIDHDTRVATPSSARGLRLGVELAGALTIHRDDAIMPGARGRIGARIDSLELTLGGSFAGPAWIETEPARYTLHRTGGALAAFARIVIDPAVLVAIGGGIEVAAFLRTTERVAGGFEATAAAWTLAAIVSPELAIEIEPWPDTTFRLGVGVDVVLVPPRFGADDGGVAVAGQELWWAAPRLTLGIGSWAAIDGSR
jgi:hypothetical protein